MPNLIIPKDYKSLLNIRQTEVAIKKVKESFDFEEVLETKAGSVVTGHCGRNTLGVLFIYE